MSSELKKVWVRVRHGVAAGQIGWISSAESTLPHLAQYRIHLENPLNVSPGFHWRRPATLHLTALDLRAFEFERLSDLEVLALAKKAHATTGGEDDE